MDKSKIIEVQELVYCYSDGTKAIDNITIDFYKGEFIALIGQNGCGKTTFSKSLNGIFKPTSGKILVNGIDTSLPKVKKQLVKNIGYVFQNPDHQLFNNNVYDEIAYAPRNIGLNEKEVKARVVEAANTAGVREEIFPEHPFFLTKGLRQRVTIASILSLKPEAIIVDEPTTGQDYKQSIEIMEFLKMLNQEHGHTIIIVTHEMDIVAKYASRVVVMADGKILTDGTVGEVYSQPELLGQANIKPPEITRIAQELGKFDFANNITSFQEMYDKWIEVSK